MAWITNKLALMGTGASVHSLTGVSLCSFQGSLRLCRFEPKAYDADQNSEYCAGRKC